MVVSSYKCDVLSQAPHTTPPHSPFPRPASFLAPLLQSLTPHSHSSHPSSPLPSSPHLILHSLALLTQAHSARLTLTCLTLKASSLRTFHHAFRIRPSPYLTAPQHPPAALPAQQTTTITTTTWEQHSRQEEPN